METLQFMKAILKQKRVLILLCLSAVVNSVVITYALSEKYDATALVILRPQSVVSFLPNPSLKEILNFPVTINIPFKAATQTYSEVIASRAIAEKIVRTLRLDVERPEPSWWKRAKNKIRDILLDAWTILKYGRIEEMDSMEKAIEQVQESISASPTKDTYVFEIKFRGKEPEVAADVANTAAHELVSYNREISKQDATRVREFLEQRVGESSVVLSRARRALQEFKERQRIVLLELELETKIKSTSDFDTALKNTRKDVEGTVAEINEIRKQLSGQERYLKSSYTYEDNPLVTELKSQLTDLEIQHSGLLKKFGTSHPEVVSTGAKIGEAKNRLREEVARILSEETSSLNSVYQTLVGDLVLTETKLQGLEAREKSLLAALAEERKDLNFSPAKEKELGRLTLDLQVAEETYRLIRRYYEDARIKEEESSSELRVASPAIPPIYPTRPIKIYYAGVALAMAFVAGIAYAVLVDYLTTTPTAPEEESLSRTLEQVQV